jgi:hypothetical protein
MKRFRLVAAALPLALIAVPGCAQDLAATAGKDARVVMDNDKVRVIELQMAPGDSTGMHSHGDNLVVFLSSGMAMQTMADGTTKPLERKPGDVMGSDPVTHDTKNTGKAKVRTLIIELKEPKP